MKFLIGSVNILLRTEYTAQAGFIVGGRQLFVTNMSFAQANSSISNLSLTVKRFADVNRDLRISIPLRRKFG